MTSDLHHLAAAYALDALDAGERRDFEAHYPSCHICNQEVREFRATAAELGAASSQAPPAELRSRVLADIAQTRQASPIEYPNQLRSKVGPQRYGGLAAAAALVLVLGFLGGFLFRGPANDRVDDLLLANDLVVTPLQGEQGTITVAWSAERDEVVLFGTEVPAVAGDQEYALWALFDDGAAPAGLFTPDEGVVREILAVGSLDGVGWGITVEPEGGSPQPTTEVLYLGTI